VFFLYHGLTRPQHSWGLLSGEGARDQVAPGMRKKDLRRAGMAQDVFEKRLPRRENLLKTCLVFHRFLL
jgi:hypothetical protein